MNSEKMIAGSSDRWETTHEEKNLNLREGLVGCKTAPRQISLPTGNPKVGMSEKKPILHLVDLTHQLVHTPLFLLHDLVAIKPLLVWSSIFCIQPLTKDHSKNMSVSL